MNKNTFIEILNDQKSIQLAETIELKSVIDKFPYFQTARALYLKGLKNQDSFKYNKELKTTAAYTLDRTVLFDFITSKAFNDDKKEISHQKADPKIEEQPSKSSIEKNEPKNLSVDQTIEETKEALEVGKPISFAQHESFSFNQWLQLSSKKTVVRKEPSKQAISKKEDIIEKFIQNNPKIEPLSKDKNVSINVAQNKHDSSLMTETLAKVYLEQKKYENAIQAYRILSLKYPEKSGFFADQIKRIQILQKHK